MSRDETNCADGDAFNAPCEFGVDANGQEILVLRELEQPGHRKSLQALQEMLELGVISQVEFQQAVAESQERNAATSASEAKLMEPYKGKNRVIMMEWEKPYMEACVDRMAIGPDSIVLEVGFGLGYSASRIQRRKPKHHVVVECNRFVLEKARKWRESLENSSGVHIVPLTWQKFLLQQRELRRGGTLQDCDSQGRLWKFTHIFFDDFPLPIADKQAQAMCAEADSRWGAFISTCAQAGVLVGGARDPHSLGALFSGYLARPIQIDGSIRASVSAAAHASKSLQATAAVGRAGKPISQPFKLDVRVPSGTSCLNGQCTVLEQVPFGVVVPPNCPYLPAGRNTLFIPILHWCCQPQTLPLPPCSEASPGTKDAAIGSTAAEPSVPHSAGHAATVRRSERAAQKSVESGQSAVQPPARKAQQRPKLHLPPPKRTTTGPPSR